MSRERPRAELFGAYRCMLRAMLEADAADLDGLLDDDFVLTHITGFRQPKREWLHAIAAGRMCYHSVREEGVTVEMTGDRALLVGRIVVDATIYGGRATWNLELRTHYQRRRSKWVALRTEASTC